MLAGVLTLWLIIDVSVWKVQGWRDRKQFAEQDVLYLGDLTTNSNAAAC